jgi:hypothetical protein
MENKLLIESLGKKHIKLLLLRIESTMVLTKTLRKIVLDQFNDFVRDLQEQVKE